MVALLYKMWMDKKKIPKNNSFPKAFRKLSERIPKTFRITPKILNYKKYFGID